MYQKPASPDSIRRIRLENGIGWTLLGFCFVLYIAVHRIAALTLPVPWGDEASFLWPAHSVAESNSLFAPQLYPDRPLFWMPPGYSIVMGLIFKLSGTSLQVAREASMVFILALIALVVLRSRGKGSILSASILCSAFLLGPSFVAAGNVARMEALVLLIAAIAFLLLDGSGVLYGVALLSLLPLVHPNGVYFAGGGLLFVVLAFPSIRQWLSWPAASIFALPVAAWTAYGIYILSHWRAFRQDMLWQWLDKMNPVSRPHMLTVWNVLTLGLFLLIGSLAFRHKDWPRLAFVCFGLSAWSIRIGSTSMWYQIYDAFTLMMLSILLMQAVEMATMTWRLPVRIPAVGVVLFACLAVASRQNFLKSPRHYLAQLEFLDMRIHSDVPYLTDSDAAALHSFLASLKSPGRPTLVEMYPWPDALYFHDLDGHGIRFVAPVMDPLFTSKFAIGQGAGLTRRQTPDVYVIHISRSLPDWLQSQVADQFRRAGLDPSDQGQMLRSRNSTEKWYATRPLHAQSHATVSASSSPHGRTELIDP